MDTYYVPIYLPTHWSDVSHHEDNLLIGVSSYSDNKIHIFSFLFNLGDHTRSVPYFRLNTNSVQNRRNGSFFLWAGRHWTRIRDPKSMSLKMFFSILRYVGIWTLLFFLKIWMKFLTIEVLQVSLKINLRSSWCQWH